MCAESTRSFMRLKLRSSVLLPHPDGPMIAVILFFGTWSADVAHRPERAVEARQLVELEDDLVVGRIIGVRSPLAAGAMRSLSSSSGGWS